jgi:hypothetical protein
MIFGGAYTFNYVSNSNNLGYKVESGPDSVADSAFNIPEMINNPKYDRVDPVLNQWLSTGVEPGHMNKVGGKTSVLFFSTGGDPTLNGAVVPVSYFKLGTSGIHMVQVLVDGVSQLRFLADNNKVLRLTADYTTNEPLSKQDPRADGLPSRSYVSSDFRPQTDNFQARELMGSNQVETDFGYDGTGVVINVDDSGVDFGHPALQGTGATKADGSPASFDPTGGLAAVTNLYSADVYYGANASDPRVTLFNQTLHTNASGYLDLTGFDDLIMWNEIYHDSYAWGDLLYTTDAYKATGIAGNTTGFTFGVNWVHTAVGHMFIPFLMADDNNDGTFDTVYYDWDTGLNYVLWWYDASANADATFAAAVDYDFTDDPAVTLASPYLYGDVRDADGVTAGSDGWPELTVGTLANIYDVYDLNANGKTAEVLPGIWPDGSGLSVFSDTGYHGTLVTGSIVAQDVLYPLYNNASDPNVEKISIKGVAPGAKVLATHGTSSTTIARAWMWAAGYEPAADGNWTIWTGDHVANVSTNSWGFPYFPDPFGGDFAPGFDPLSLIVEMFSVPGELTAESPGLLFVFSSGNSGNGYGTMSMPVPASAIMVGASTSMRPLTNYSSSDWNDTQGANEIIGFSSSGPGGNNYPKIDVVNYGYYDYSTYPTSPFYSVGQGEGTGANNTYYLWAGTSESAPFTAGALALVFEAYKDQQASKLDPEKAKVILKSSATDLGYDAYMQGSGQVNAYDAVVMARTDAGYLFGTDGAVEAGKQFAATMEFYFGEPPSRGLPGLPFTVPASPNWDTTLAFGTLLADSGDSATQSLTTMESASASPVRFVEDSKATVSSTTEDTYTYHSFSDNFSSTLSSDFLQVILTVDPATWADAEANGGAFRVMIGNDTDGGAITGFDRQLFTVGYNTYHSMVVTVSTRQLTTNSWIAVYDTMWTDSYEGDLEPGADYSLTVRAFSRSADAALIVETGAGTTHDFHVDTTGLAPGFYNGFVMFDSGLLAEYTYSIALEVSDYDATNSFATSGPERGVAYDSEMVGVVSYGDTPNDGDWRWMDLYVGTAATNTLAIEVNWTSPGSVIDVYLFDTNYTLVVDSNPVWSADSTWESYATGSSSNQTRLLANLTGFDLSVEDNKYFTLALHLVEMNTTFGPTATFEVGATYLNAKVSDFESTPTFVGSNLEQLTDGTPVTDQVAGVSWAGPAGGNPIPRFDPANGYTTLNINSALSFSDSGTVAAPVLDGGNFNFFDYTHEIYILGGMLVTLTFGWSDGSDLDVVMVAKGTAPSYDSDLGGGAASTGANPETLSFIAPETDTYVIYVVYYDGTGAPYDYTVELSALAAVASLVSEDSGSISLDMVGQGLVSDASYVLTSENHASWNGGEALSTKFQYNPVGPQVAPLGYLGELLGSTVSLGVVRDGVAFDLTVMKGTTTVFTGTDLEAGPHDIVINTSDLDGWDNTTFTYSAEDEFGKTTTGTFWAKRLDRRSPSFSALADVEGKAGKDITLTWTVADSSFGTYKVLIGGVEQTDMAGTWVPGPVSIVLNFKDKGEYFVQMEFTDVDGNYASDVVKVTVTKKSSSGGGFLPFNFMFMLIAIPVLVALKKKSSL